MTAADDVVFLLDVDNTLLDNDRVQGDLRNHLEREFGAASRDRYWAIFEALRAELGYADYLGALQRYRLGALNDPRLLQMSAFLVDYPFADRLYPGALGAIEHLRRWGPAVILSDGDVVFQPRKIQRSGLWEAVEGRVLIYIHKERMLDDVAQRYPARHYVMVDDKLRILAAMKKILENRLTTVFPRQGHYALDPHNLSAYPPADLAIEGIGDLLDCDFSAFFSGLPGPSMGNRRQHERYTAASRSGPKPLARQHYARATEEWHAQPLYQGVCGDGAHL
jgi:FMN phosphatase YigB (HAD superfamily)